MNLKHLVKEFWVMNSMCLWKAPEGVQTDLFGNAIEIAAVRMQIEKTEDNEIEIKV